MPVITRRSRVGALESHLKGIVHRWLSAAGCFPFEEVNTSWGIVDVMGIRPNVDRSLERLRSGQKQPIGDSRSVAVLLTLPTRASKRSISREELHAKYSDQLGAAALERILATLVRKRMAATTATGRFCRTIDVLPFHEEIVCVELKLSRIDEVLAQARRHRIAATSSYVGLPKDVAERVAFSERRTEFESLGVGLLSLWDDNCFVLIPAVSTDGERELAYEIALAEKTWSKIQRQFSIS